jgi:CBS domain-containing protein
LPVVQSADLRKEAVGFVVAVVWVAFAFAVVGLAKWAFGHQQNPIQIGGSVLIALMLLPLGVYLVATGKLLEFNVAGAKAKFAAKEKIKLTPDTITYDDPQIVAREGGVRKLLARKAQEKDQSRPVVMTMTIGGKIYTRPDIRSLLDVLTQLRSFKLVVFLDRNKRVVAYMEAWALKELVEQDELAAEFVQFINSGPESGIDNFSVAKKTISTTSTNIEALRDMQEQNLEALVVVDDQKMLRGVVQREQVLSSIMLSLAS